MTRRRRRLPAVCCAGGLATLVFATHVFAQNAASAAAEVVPLLENVTRLEGWSFFAPPPNGGDPNYALLANRATLGVRVDGRRLAVQGAVRYAQIVGLPQTATGPGAFGSGALYFAAARNRAAYQLYFKALSLRVKELLPHLSIEAGRMAYESAEGTPFAGRLVGNAEWTIFERAFDGLRADYEAASWRAHASFVMPTQGAFEESANPTIERVRVGSASWTMAGVQLFAHTYRDTRPLRARPDNSGRLAPNADIRVHTFGGSLVRTLAAAQLRAWGAVQQGRWYDVRHRAFSGSADARYRLDASWQPTIHAGVLYASGDPDSADDRHETFFPMLPTTAPDVLGGMFAQMNLRDVYGGAVLRPHPRLTIAADAHRLALPTTNDRWYSGTGATALEGSYFGYSGRSAQLATDLGSYLQLSAEHAPSRFWTLKASAAFVHGGTVVRRQFAGEWLRVIQVESRIRLP